MKQDNSSEKVVKQDKQSYETDIGWMFIASLVFPFSLSGFLAGLLARHDDEAAKDLFSAWFGIYIVIVAIIICIVYSHFR